MSVMMNITVSLHLAALATTALSVRDYYMSAQLKRLLAMLYKTMFLEILDPLHLNTALCKEYRRLKILCHQNSRCSMSYLAMNAQRVNNFKPKVNDVTNKKLCSLFSFPSISLLLFSL